MNKKFDFLTKYNPVLGGSLNNYRPNFISEIKGTTTNTQNLQSINEISVKRLLGKHADSGYIMISASRYEPDIDVQQNNEINNTNYKKLLAAIKNSGYSYIPVYGGFIENQGGEVQKEVYEKSFIVFNYNRNGEQIDFKQLHNLAIQWCNEFNQDSVLIKAPNQNPAYYGSEGDEQMKFTGDIKIDDLTQQYFTDFVKSKQRNINKQGDEYSKQHRLTFENVFVNPAPVTYSEGHVRYALNEVHLGLVEK